MKKRVLTSTPHELILTVKSYVSVLIMLYYAGRQNGCRTAKNKRPETLQFQAFYGGDKRDRTADLLTASQALSQLSYTPILLELSRQQ